jgi:hypothetical protein
MRISDPSQECSGSNCCHVFRKSRRQGRLGAIGVCGIGALKPNESPGRERTNELGGT